jgi:hypothetical protein
MLLRLVIVSLGLRNHTVAILDSTGETALDPAVYGPESRRNLGLLVVHP